MTAIPYPFINGIRYDWSSLEIDISGPVAGVKELSYGHSLSPGIIRGTRSQPLGRTRGKYEPEASMTLYRSEYNDLTTKLTAQGASVGMGFMEVSFMITVAYSEAYSDVIIDKVIGCRIKKAEHGGSEGEDPMVVKCDLDVMAIIENGKSPIGYRNWLKP